MLPSVQWPTSGSSCMSLLMICTSCISLMSLADWVNNVHRLMLMCIHGWQVSTWLFVTCHNDAVGSRHHLAWHSPLRHRGFNMGLEHSNAHNVEQCVCHGAMPTVLPGSVLHPGNAPHTHARLHIPHPLKSALRHAPHVGGEGSVRVVAEWRPHNYGSVPLHRAGRRILLHRGIHHHHVIRPPHPQKTHQLAPG
jgi:hypothetical protein